LAPGKQDLCKKDIKRPDGAQQAGYPADRAFDVVRFAISGHMPKERHRGPQPAQCNAHIMQRFSRARDRGLSVR
jgi:hypothetical protein